MERLLMKYLILWVLIVPFIVFGKSGIEDALRQHERLTYNPLGEQVHSLKFNLEIEGLASKLTALNRYGEIKKLWFEISWNYPTKETDITIVGVKGRFDGLIKELKFSAQEKLKYLFYRDIFESFKDHTWSIVPADSETLDDKDLNYYRGIDPTGKLPANTVLVAFDKKGLLTETTVFSTSGKTKTTYKYESSKPFNNKSLLRTVIVSMQESAESVEVKHEIEYQKTLGFYFPSKVVSTSLTGTGSKKSQIQAVTNLYDYKLNTFALKNSEN